MNKFTDVLAIVATLPMAAQTANMQDRALWGSIAVSPSSGAINLGDYQNANNKVLLTWLMTDHTYYMQAIHENVGYNQPTNVGYYLTSDYASDTEIWAAAAKAEADRLAALEQTLTGISATLNDKGKMINDKVFYDLQGRKIDTPRRGIYIRNGRKVVIR